MRFVKLCCLLVTLSAVHCQYAYPPPYSPYRMPVQPASAPEQPEGQAPPRYSYPGAQPQYLPPAGYPPQLYSIPGPPPDLPEVESPPPGPRAQSPYVPGQPVYAVPQSYYQPPPQPIYAQPPYPPSYQPSEEPAAYTEPRAYDLSRAIDAYAALQSPPVGTWAAPQPQPPAAPAVQPYPPQYMLVPQSQTIDWYPNSNPAPAPTRLSNRAMAPPVQPTSSALRSPSQLAAGYPTPPASRPLSAPAPAQRRQASPPPECGTRAEPGVCCNPPLTCPDISLIEDETNNCTFQKPHSQCCSPGTCKPPAPPVNPFTPPRRRPAYRAAIRPAPPVQYGRLF